MATTYTTVETSTMLLLVSCFVGRRHCTKLTLSSAYALASQPQKTLKAYEKAHAWRELFAAAKKQELSQEAISEMVERVTGQLHSPQL
jgi:elongator complex protein 1